MATGKRRRNSITRLIEDVVDDAKDLVDDVVDRAKDVERDGRKAVRRAVNDDDGDRNGRNGHDDREMDDLKSAIDDLTAKVERLVALQAEARKPNQYGGVAEPVRLIKRYANRKLYDTGSGELTSLRRIEELVREGVDIRVVDHDTGEDMTSEILVGILGNSMHDGTIAGDTLLLTSLIRTPNDLLAAMMADEQRTEELRSMGERVRLLSATIDALLGQMDQGGGEPAADERPKPAPRKRTGPAKARS